MSCRSGSLRVGLLTFLCYAVMLGSAFAVRPQLSTCFVLNAFSGHDGIQFFGISLDVFSETPRAEKHRYLRVAYPAAAHLVAKALDATVPAAWVPTQVPMQGVGLVPRHYLFCSASLVLLNLLFVSLAAATLYRLLEPTFPNPGLISFLLLVPNYVIASSMARCLTEPLVLLAVFRFVLAWRRWPWSAELFVWAVLAPFIKEYLLALPLAWCLAQMLSPGAADLRFEEGFWRRGGLWDVRRWGVAALGVLLVVPYLIYWHLVAARFGETMVSLKSAHADPATGLPIGWPFLGYAAGIRELISEPLTVESTSRYYFLMDAGYRALHLGLYGMLLWLFFVATPWAMLQGRMQRWQGFVHLLFLMLCALLTHNTTHSAADLGRIMAASPAFWAAGAAQLQGRWWRLAWVVVNVGLVVAQWLRLLVIASRGGVQLESSLDILGLLPG